MAVYFAPPRRDPNAELKRYMLQMAQMYGDKRTATAERGKLKSFAESISPLDISTINDQRLFSPGGQESLQAALFEGGPAKFSQRPGQQTLSPQQIMQKALLANVPIEKAMQLAQTLGRTDLSATQRKGEIQFRAYTSAKNVPETHRSARQQKTVDRYESGGPLVQIGGLPGGFQFLSPEEQATQAKAELRKKVAPRALTPTEQKGVQATIDSIVGEAKALPFGAKPGVAVSQKDIGELWESTAEATGYAGRDKVQQKQIENAFDRKIAVLNKGKGITFLKNQYQWNRSLYNKTHRLPGESVDDFIKRTGL